MGCCGKIKGAVKLARAEIGLRVLTPDVTLERRRACESCESWDHGRCTAVNPQTGKPCGCYTWAKTRIPSETCPLGRWDAPRD